MGNSHRPGSARQWCFAAMPVCCQLELMRHIEQFGFREILANQMHPNWQAIDYSGRYRHAGQARQIHGDGVDVFKIHGYRIRLRTQLERSMR